MFNFILIMLSSFMLTMVVLSHFVDNFFTIFFDSLSVIGAVVGIIGLWFSYKSWKNTNDIASAMRLEQIRRAYPSKHREFVSSVDKAITALQNDNRDWKIIYDLYAAFSSIRMFNVDWEPAAREVIEACFNQLEELEPQEKIDDDLRDDLLKCLTQVKVLSDRASVINNIK